MLEVEEILHSLTISNNKYDNNLKLESIVKDILVLAYKEPNYLHCCTKQHDEARQ